MTIKEVARDLGVSESYIYGLIEDGMVDYYVIQKRIPVNPIINQLRRDTYEKQGVLEIKILGLNPEEVEYIDWYIREGRKTNKGIRTIAKNNKEFQEQNRRKKMTIEVYY